MLVSCFLLFTLALTANADSLATSKSVKAIVCTLFLDLRYMQEWITYNRYLGFDFLQLYDNTPSFEGKELESNYGDFVRVMHAPHMKHWDAMNDCLARYQNETWWAAAIDSDEFIVLHKHESIKHLLAEMVPNGGSLSLNWFLFGSNGHVTDSYEPVLQRFTARVKNTNQHVKSISFIPDVKNLNCHSPTFKNSNMTQVDTRGHHFLGSFNVGGPYDVAQINHYITKSAEECHHKMKHHRSDGLNHTAIYCTFHDFNDVQDSSAWDFFRTKQIEESKISLKATAGFGK